MDASSILGKFVKLYNHNHNPVLEHLWLPSECIPWILFSILNENPTKYLNFSWVVLWNKRLPTKWHKMNFCRINTILNDKELLDFSIQLELHLMTCGRNMGIMQKTKLDILMKEGLC